jgi:hypothetical protein
MVGEGLTYELAIAGGGLRHLEELDWTCTKQNAGAHMDIAVAKA